MSSYITIWRHNFDYTLLADILHNINLILMTESPTKHFIQQRITAILNIPIFVFLLYLLFIIPGMSYSGVIDLFQKPVVLALTLLLTFNFSYHMKLGMQMIIEDYIHGKKNLKLALLLNNIFVSIVIIGCTYSLLTL